MAGSFAASLHFRRTFLASALCLLAFVFAVEAKTAWYRAAGRAAGSISAAKALPASTPKLVQHGISASHSSPAQALLALLVVASASWIAALATRAHGTVLCHDLPSFNATWFSPACFLRPPPAL
jgi:hypothetical protein